VAENTHNVPTHRGWEAEWALVAGYIPRWFAHLEIVTHPSTIGLVVE